MAAVGVLPPLPLPGTGDGEHDSGRLDVGVEGAAVAGEGDAGELAELRLLRGADVEFVAGDRVGAAAVGGAEQVLDALAVLGDDEAAVRETVMLSGPSKAPSLDGSGLTPMRTFRVRVRRLGS